MRNVDFINSFLVSTTNVLKIQANVTAEAAKSFMKTPKDKCVADISGKIVVESSTVKGSVAICFPEKTFLKIMSGMIGEEYNELKPEIIDGAGEITNMIFGQAKIILNEKGHNIQMALPTVVTGKEHGLVDAKNPVLIIPFSGNAGDFFMEILLAA